MGHALIELMKRGTKLIMADPRVNWLASRADQVLQLIPGTDAALCLAILNVLINEDLVDHDYIDRWCFGFDELKERVQEYTPAYAAKECGLTEEEIITAARKLGYDGVHHWSLLMGVAVDQNPNGCQVTQCLIAMAAITGNLDVPGGTVVGVQMQFEMTGATDYMSEELKNKCIGYLSHREGSSEHHASRHHARVLGDRTSLRTQDGVVRLDESPVANLLGATEALARRPHENGVRRG